MNDNDIPFKNDRYGFMAYVSEISSSQEDLLRVCRFVGEPDVSQDDGVRREPSSLPNTGGNSVVPTPVILLSDDDDDRKDNSVPQDHPFYTPLEQSSLLSSSDCFEICKVNQTPDVDNLRAGCEDLGRDSDLGFHEVEFNEFLVIEREPLPLNDDSGKSVPKKLKLSEKNLSLGNSSGVCFGIESRNGMQDVAICKGKMVSDTKNSCNFAYDGQSQHNILDSEETSVRVGENARKLPCVDEGNKSTENTIGTSERNNNRTDEELFEKLLASIQGFLECSAKGRGLEIGKVQRDHKGKAMVDNEEERVEVGASTDEICEAENLVGTVEKVSEAVERRRRTDNQLLCLVNTEKTLKFEKGRQKPGCKSGKGFQQERKPSILDALRVIKELKTENEDEQDYNPPGTSLLEAAMSCGWNFPRARWWSEKRRFINSKKN